MGEDEAQIVEEYLSLGIDRLAYIVPLLPYLNAIIAFLKALGEQLAMPFLEQQGITKQGDTYYFTYEEKNYTAKVEEGKYTVTQDDTEHYLEYDEEQNYMFIV